MDEAPLVKLYRYEFYAKVQNGVNPAPVIVMVSTQPVDSPEVRTAVDQVYGQLVQQHGIGVPRPAYYSVTELHALPARDDAAQEKSVMLVVPQNGHRR